MKPREVLLSNEFGTASISLLGATVLSWQPKGYDDVLWVSDDSQFRPGKAIRGGIPVCWPWFASDPAHPKGPSHGLVRAREWSVERQDAGAATLAIAWEDATVFPPFRLKLSVTLGPALTVALTHHNLSDRDVACTGALHTYLRANASTAVVRGLGAAPAFDKVEAKNITVADPIRFKGKTDLVVTTNELAIMEDGTRRVEVHREQAPDAVLWNPAQDRPGDIRAGAETEFVCVEAAAVRAPWVVPANGSRTLSTRLVVPG